MKLENPERFNIELAEKTLDFVNSHPEQHNQRVPKCGSVGCIAGWATTLGMSRWAYVFNPKSYFEMSTELLGLEETEMYEIYSELREDKAKEILADFIHQAYVAQGVERLD